VDSEFWIVLNRGGEGTQAVTNPDAHSGAPYAYEEKNKEEAPTTVVIEAYGTKEGTRTLTALRPLRPERSASANSATLAWGL
jgi:hypothetical protein